MNETRERVEKVRALGFALTMDEVREKSNGRAAARGQDRPGPPREPRERAESRLSELYYRPENRPYAPYMFYEDYFAEGKPAYVPKKFIALARRPRRRPGDRRGARCLSHPGAYFQRTTAEDARELKDHGLVGLEVYTFYHTAEQTAFYRDLAAELDLVATAGSDFHGRIKPHVAFGALPDGDYGMVEALRARRGGAA